jgi:hypothetical protein
MTYMKWIYFYRGDSFKKSLVMSEVEEVVNKFNILDSALKNIFSKVDPLLIISLIFDRNANENRIYTLEVILKPGQDTKAIRQEVVDKTGMTPSFYLSGTKMVVSHTLNLEFLKWINDRPDIISIKGSKFSAAGSSDF